MRNEEKSFSKTSINCEKTIYRKFLKTIDNTDSLKIRFLHFINKKEVNYD